jgi:ribosomal protein L33
MKTGNFLKIISLLLIFTSACKTFKKDDAKSPEAITVKFLTLMSQMEFEKAKQFGTYKTGQMLDVFILALSSAKKKDSAFKVEKKEVNIIILKCEKQGDFAVVTYSSNEGKQDRMELVKQDGRWLVDLKKESPQLKNFQPKFKQ